MESKWIELESPVFAWSRHGHGGALYPVVFHGLISRGEALQIVRQHNLKPGEESLSLADLAQRYPIDGEPPRGVKPVVESHDAEHDPIESRLSTATFVLGVTALLLFILAALIFPA